MDPEELARLGFQPDPPDFVADEPARAEPPELDLSGIGDFGKQATPTVDYGRERPDDMVETGRTRRTLVLPEMSGLERPGEPVGDATVVEDREVRAPTAFESFAQWAHDQTEGQGLSIPGLFGLEEPSAQSVANASRPGMDASERINAAIPTAPRPEGMSASARDLRTQAGMLGLVDAMTGGFADERQGAIEALLRRRDYRSARNAAREEMAAARQQAPAAFAMGETAPNLALGLAGAPTAPTALGRVEQAAGLGAGLGALSGAGSAEEIVDVPGEAALQAAIGGATAGVLQGAGEGVSRGIGWLGGLLSRRGDAAAQAAIPSRLEATGVWGGRAMRAADELPGGQEALAADLRRLGIGQGAESAQTPADLAMFPRPERAIGDAGEIAERAAARLNDVAAQMDDAAAQARNAVLERPGMERAINPRQTTETIDPLRAVQPRTHRDMASLRAAYEGLSPEEATAVASGARPSATGQQMEPITLTENRLPDGSRRLVLTDGNHRLAAAREAGATSIAARIRRLSPEGDETIVERVLPIGRLERQTGSGLSRNYREIAEVGPRAGQVGRVDIRPVLAEMDQAAAELERIPIGGPRAADAIRARVIEPLAQHADEGMSFTDAWAQRRALDREIAAWESDPNLMSASGQLQTARQAISRAMDSATAQLSPEAQAAWRQANRDYSVAAFIAEHGRGAQRLSVGGGIGGAVGTAIENTMGQVPIAGGMLQREAAQQTRMMWPGIRAASLERLAPILQSMGPRVAQYAQALRQAASQGTLPVTHYVLSQTNPEYRAAIERAQEMEQAQ